MRRGIWSELGTPAATIDVYRRNTQRVYLDTIDNRLNANGATSDEVRSLLKGELKALDEQLKTVVAQRAPAGDAATTRHLQDARDQIAEILDPRAMRTPPAAVAGGGRRGGGAGPGAIAGPQPERYKFDYDNDPFLKPATTCFPDLIIK